MATVTIEVDGGAHSESIAVPLIQDFQNPENYFGIGFTANSGGYYGLGSQMFPGFFSNEVLMAAVSGVSPNTGNRDTRGVTGGIVLTNITGLSHVYKVTFNLNDAANFASTATRGDTAHTASGPAGTSYESVAGSALYAAQIDGVTIATLLDDPQSFALQPTTSIAANADFGGPLANPTFPGGPLVDDISIVWEFELGSLAQASFNSDFYVVVPEPSSWGLLVAGMFAIACWRRRSR
ncbi:MAG: PEP-CTERM sorting domain-containing protein [Pirellulales bacterium]|nr:PEP-CTERM sorting domain-containing protein [Pirellulales bacterium]